MANKHQVLELLAKGLTPQEVAKKLNCSDAYVRATRRRASPDGAELMRTWKRNWLQTKRGKQANRAKTQKRYRRIIASKKGREALCAYRRGERSFPRAGIDYS